MLKINISKVRLYYASFNLYNFSAGLIGVFLNLFILATSSLLDVVYFNIIYYGSLEVLYFASAYALGRFHPKDLYIIGAVIRAFTLILILLAALYVSNILIFGFLYGASIGTFWLGNNILISDVSKEVDRKEFVLKLNVIGDVVNLAAPTAAGIMIQFSQFAGPLRFAYDFIAAMIIMIASAYTLSRAKFPKEQDSKRFSIKDTAIKYTGYGYFKIYAIANSMFAIPYTMILPVYVFLITDSYVITGIYGSMIILLSIFANYLTKMDESHWDTFLKAGIALSILSSIPLLFPGSFNSLTWVFIFTIVYTVFLTPIQNQASSNFIELIDESKINRIYFWINREYYIIIGRAIALVAIVLALIFFSSKIIYVVYIIPFMTLSIVTCLWASYKKSSVRQPLMKGSRPEMLP